MLDAFSGIHEPNDSNYPEEWIASVIVARNAGREHIIGEGLSKIDDGTSTTLRDVIASDPACILGDKHFRKFGDSLGVLVKLIDSSERLTIQAHPNRVTAKKLFGSNYGKTECWHILEGRSINGRAPVIYVGFKPGITREKWIRLFKLQDHKKMSDCLHEFPANPGDTFLVEGGVPHAIGGGCFLVEIQEPTDYTIRVEKVTESGMEINDLSCHQGLGYEKMFDCFTYIGLSKEDTDKKWHIKPRALNTCSGSTEYEIVGYRDTPYFRAKITEINGIYETNTGGSFSGLLVLSGEGNIETNGYVQHVRKSDQFFIPAGVGKLKITVDTPGTLKIVRFFGPKV